MEDETKTNYDKWKAEQKAKGDKQPASLYKERVELRGLQAQKLATDKNPYLTTPVMLKDLVAEDFTYEFIWDDYIAFSHITTLSAHPKVGKSTLIGSLLKAMEVEGLFLDKKTHEHPVLIVSEESEHHWVQRRDKLSLKLPISVWCSPLTHRLNASEWEAFVQDIKLYCEENQIRFVVFDTISKFWSVKEENAAADMDAAFLPLNILKTAGFAVLLVHHFRKAGGDYGLGARGSSVFGATPDCLIDFTRVDDQNPSFRKVSAISRFPETPESMVINFDGKSYFRDDLKKAKDDKRKKTVTDIINQIMEEQIEGATVQEVLDNWDEDSVKLPSRRTIQRFLKEKVKSGDFVISGKKKMRGGEALVFQPAKNNTLSIGIARVTEASEGEKDLETSRVLKALDRMEID